MLHRLHPLSLLRYGKEATPCCLSLPLTTIYRKHITLPAHQPQSRLFPIPFFHSTAVQRAMRLHHWYHSGVRAVSIRQSVNAGGLRRLSETQREGTPQHRARPTRDIEELLCAKRCGVRTIRIPHLCLDGWNMSIVESISPISGNKIGKPEEDYSAIPKGIPTVTRGHINVHPWIHLV